MKDLQLWIDSLALTHSPNFDECVSFLGSYFPLLHQFSETEQDKIWHAEGDVAIHTDMVLSQLYCLLTLEAQHIVGSKRQVLIISALLHDIAKPLTTRRKVINAVERIVASKHEEIGASYLATKLIELPLAYESVEMIMGLVGFHQVPKLLVVRNKNYSDYFHLSLNADLELLYWLELADMKGRICEDLTKQIDLLEQFRMFAEEYELWSIENSIKPIINKIQVKTSYSEQQFLDGYVVRQLAHEQISMAEEGIAKNYEASQQYSNLYVMCGISGSGKSSWIKQHLNTFEVISLDEIREELNGKRDSQKNRGQMLQLAKSRLKSALANKRNVVWDATNIRKDFRKIICDIGLNYGALITIVAFQINKNHLLKNNKNRQHTIDDNILVNQLEKLEWPSVTEGHRMLIIGEQGKELMRRGSFKEAE